MKTALLTILFIAYGIISNPFSHASQVSTSVHEQMISKKFDDIVRSVLIKGTIKKPSLEPVPAAMVQLFTSNGTYIETTVSSPTGWYEFNLVAPGTYKIITSATGYTLSIIYVTVTNTSGDQDIIILPE